MTDFISDLEIELLAAARRRATHRRHFTWRPPLRGALVVAVALAAILVAVMLTLRPKPDERPAPTTPGGFVPPEAAPAQPCLHAVPGTPAPDAVFDELALLRRMPTTRDRLPAFGETPPDSWLPVGAFDPQSPRRPQDIEGLTVVPTLDVRERSGACDKGTKRGPGACLVAGGGATPIRVRCFTLAEIRAGRAFAVADGRLLGLVRDGIDAVELSAAGATTRLSVHENTVVGTANPGAPISLRLVAHGPRVVVAGERAQAEAVVARLRARLGVDAEVAAARNPGDFVVVQAIRPDSPRLARDVASVLNADRLNANPPRNAKIQPNTPDVVVWLRMR